MSKELRAKESSIPLRYIGPMVIFIAISVFVVFLIIVLNPKPVFIAEAERNALVAEWAKDVANNSDSSQQRDFFVNSVGFAAIDGYIDNDEFNIISMNYEDFKEYNNKRSIEKSLSEMGFQDDVFPGLKETGAVKDLALFQSLPEQVDSDK